MFQYIFAKMDLEVTAIDASNLGLEKNLKKLFFLKKKILNIKNFCMDLNHWETKEKYDVIVASYLHMFKMKEKFI